MQISLFDLEGQEKENTHSYNCSKYRLELIKDTSYAYSGTVLKSPDCVVDFLRDVLKVHRQAEEISMVLCLNTKCEVFSIYEVSRGSLNAAIVHPREVFKRVILSNAASYIFCHNHPSGHVTPSKEDDLITERLKDAGDLLGIPLIDHLIIGECTYHSYKEAGTI